MKTVLITGGAGFVGSHLADELLAAGYHVRVLDNLTEQVHGKGARFPDYLNPAVETYQGDVRDRDTVHQALKGVEAVFHFAAAVGVGQSMYEIEHYVDINNRGTAVLLEALLAQKSRIKRLVMASSMSLYGEGLYQNSKGEQISPPERSLSALKADQWELTDAKGEALTPMPTPEDKIPAPASIYALSKYDQEKMSLLFGHAYDVPTVALRFFNIYGPRQALSNPYTGVLAIFCARYLNDKPPLIFEDGQQRRDFVSVHDVARACRLALETPQAQGQVFNIGSGQAYTILEIASRIAQVLGKAHLGPERTGRYRAGDIRHCFADITQARTVLGFAPQVELEAGLTELARWLEGQVAQDRVEVMAGELTRRGLSA